MSTDYRPTPLQVLTLLTLLVQKQCKISDASRAGHCQFDALALDLRFYSYKSKVKLLTLLAQAQATANDALAHQISWRFVCDLLALLDMSKPRGDPARQASVFALLCLESK